MSSAPESFMLYYTRRLRLPSDAMRAPRSALARYVHASIRYYKPGGGREVDKRHAKKCVY